jgi:hypothetical protein
VYRAVSSGTFKDSVLTAEAMRYRNVCEHDLKTNWKELVVVYSKLRSHGSPVKKKKKKEQDRGMSV